MIDPIAPAKMLQQIKSMGILWRLTTSETGYSLELLAPIFR